MTGKNRAMIEKSDCEIVFKDNARSKVAVDDFAEYAGWTSHFMKEPDTGVAGSHGSAVQAVF